jgi:hypothetical protein
MDYLLLSLLSSGFTSLELFLFFAGSMLAIAAICFSLRNL